MTLKNDDIIILKDQVFKVKEVKRNSCLGYDAGDHCKTIYDRYHKGDVMGCQNLIFKLVETDKDC